MFENKRGNGKKLAEGELQDDSPGGYRSTLLSLKRKLAKKLNWTLNDIDETDFCNLLAFIQFDGNDPNTRVINGKEYMRVNTPPSWL